MGKGQAQKAEGATAAQEAIAREQTGIAKELIAETRPMRQSANKYYTDIMGGGRAADVAAAPQLNIIRKQFSQAQKQAQAMEPGGQRDAMLRDLELGKFGALVQARTAPIQEAAARVASMGWGGTQQGVGTFGQAAGTYGQAAQNYTQLAQMRSSMWSGLGAGLGGLAGMI